MSTATILTAAGAIALAVLVFLAMAILARISLALESLDNAIRGGLQQAVADRAAGRDLLREIAGQLELTRAQAERVHAAQIGERYRAWGGKP